MPLVGSLVPVPVFRNGHAQSERAHGCARQPCAWLPDGDEPVEPAVLPDRRVPRHRGRRAARHRADRHHRDAAADHVRPAAGVGADHAVRHLLRRAVRRLDHRDPDQPAGRVFVGRHRARRLPHGATGQGRARARDCRDRFVHRRIVRDSAGRAVRAAAGRGGAEVRPRGIFLADGAWPRRLDRAGERFAAARARDGGGRSGAGSGRHRRQLRRRALQLRLPAARRRHRLRGDRDGHVRPGRDRRQPRARRHAHRDDHAA